MGTDSEHDYIIDTERTSGPSSDRINTPEKLEEWMTAKAEEYAEDHDVEDSDPRGRFYVAKTIEYQSESGLTQTGSAPGFHGGTWSLATCKKTMRGYGTVDDQFHPKTRAGIRHPKYPFFVAVFGSRDPDRYDGIPPGAKEHQNWLVSVSLVTAGFERMDEMADYISKNHPTDAIVNRRTAASNSTPRGKNRGDIHVNDDHTVVYPPETHQHGTKGVGSSSHCGCSHEGSAGRDPLDHEDNQHNHIKMVADPGYWVSWCHPSFAFKDGLEQGNRKLDGDYGSLINNLVAIE